MQSQQYAACSAGKYYKYFKYQCKLHLKYTLTCAFCILFQIHFAVFEYSEQIISCKIQLLVSTL